MPDPLLSGSAYSILNAILSAENHSSDLETTSSGWQFLHALKGTAGAEGLAASSSRVHAAVVTGEYFAGLTAEDAALTEIINGAPLSVVYPSTGTIAVPDGVALIQNAPHEENARLFIDFVLGQDVQRIVSARWFRRSVRNDIPLPSGAEPFERLKILPYDIYTAARNREDILQQWKVENRKEE
ncbi:MAG: substrate-binding domain-containing protein, partial [Spirochaetaceae bacterium]|jgi:iron(III) transport system substrate-binding protein|nr:substrate-binding domain-containing protein [Spirochaetaceae bacterium]